MILIPLIVANLVLAEVYHSLDERPSAGLHYFACAALIGIFFMGKLNA